MSETARAADRRRVHRVAREARVLPALFCPKTLRSFEPLMRLDSI